MNPINLRLGVVLFTAWLSVASSGCASPVRAGGTDGSPPLAGDDVRTNDSPADPVRAQVADQPPRAAPAVPGRRALVEPRSGATRAVPSKPRSPGAQRGVASYYADKYHGRKTASGEVFDQRRMTAAHRTLPFGTHVRVTALAAGRSVVVRVNDRGPFVAGRVIDLSRAAAERLGMVRAGLAEITVEPLAPPVAAVARRR